MKFFAFTIFALAAAVTCVLGANVALLSADAKEISAAVTEVHTVIGHLPATGADLVFIANLRNAATNLISILRRATVNVQSTTSISITDARTLLGVIAPIKVESVSTLLDLQGEKAQLQGYEAAIVVLLQEFAHDTDAYAGAYLARTPPIYASVVAGFRADIGFAYSKCIDYYKSG